MNRIRWFRLGTKGDLNMLVRQLSSKVFALEEPVSSGFRIEKKDKAGFAGQFIHKRTVDQNITLPSGEEFVQEIASIDITKFGIDTNSSDVLLSTYDAPRSLTSFFSTLSEATNFTCTVDPIEVDVDQWVHHITTDRSAVSVTFLDTTGIVISHDIQARLAMSGSSDVYAAMLDFLGPTRKGVIESAKIRFLLDGCYYILELGRRATLKIPAGFPAQGVDILRRAMLLSRLRRDRL